MELATWVRFAFSQGWVCIRSYCHGSGHEAFDKHAQSKYRPTLGECIAWVEGVTLGNVVPPQGGGNIEALLHESDLFQSDAETGAPSPWGDPTAHATITAASASGGLHAIYNRPRGLAKRRWIRALPLVDLLTKGVWPLPGCRRDGDARKPAGSWRALGDPFPPADPPEWVLSGIPVQSPSNPSPIPGTATGYGPRALASEVARLSSVAQGGVNDALNRSGYRMGRLVGSGALDRQAALDALLGASVRADWDERKSRDTLERALAAGAGNPRGPGARPEITITIGPEPIPSALPHLCREVLTPGAHLASDGSYTEQPSGAFCTQVLDALPPGTLYRRDTIPGHVHGARFHPASPDTIRRLCDKPNVRLAKWTKVGRGASEHQAKLYQLCSTQEAGVLLDYAAHHLPEIRLLTSYPVILPDFTVSPPGFHAPSGTYYAGEPIEPITETAAIKAHLEDLVIDFAFEDDASKHNFFGFLLTPILREVVGGSVPMHVFSSPKAGSGKGYLINKVAGGSITGRTLGSATLPKRQEELNQWTFSLARSGKTLVHIDNLPQEVDSGDLAALITGEWLDNRVLGVSGFGEARNTLTVALSGNNLGLSDELMRRSVIVRLKPLGARPEDRTDWKHPDIGDYCIEHRPRTLACLLGAVLGWVGAGSPAGETPLGSFERWARVVGGILHHLGYTKHLANRAEWRDRGGLGHEEAVESMLRAWWAAFCEATVTPAEAMSALLPCMVELWERPSAIVLGKLLASLADRVFKISDNVEVRVIRGWTAKRNRGYCLESVAVRRAEML